MYGSKAGTSSGLVSRFMVMHLPPTNPLMPDGSPIPTDDLNTQYVEPDTMLFSKEIFDNVSTAKISAQSLQVLHDSAHDDLGRPVPAELYVSEEVFVTFERREEEGINPVKAAIKRQGASCNTSFVQHISELWKLEKYGIELTSTAIANTIFYNLRAILSPTSTIPMRAMFFSDAPVGVIHLPSTF